MHTDGDGFDHCGFVEAELVGERINNSRWHGYELREGTVPTELAARDAEDLSIVAEVDLSGLAEATVTAGDRGVE